MSWLRIFKGCRGCSCKPPKTGANIEYCTIAHSWWGGKVLRHPQVQAVLLSKSTRLRQCHAVGYAAAVKCSLIPRISWANRYRHRSLYDDYVEFSDRSASVLPFSLSIPCCFQRLIYILCIKTHKSCICTTGNQIVYIRSGKILSVHVKIARLRMRGPRHTHEIT